MNRQTENKIEMNSESGNAIFLIILAVALFAALGFAFNSSNRGSTSLLTDQQARAQANQIIAYGNEVRQTVKRLTLRGCEDTEISFENAVISGYSNPNAPTNNKCHVFDIAGGGLSWKEFDSSETIFSIANRITGVGTEGADGYDLSLYIRDINTTVCSEINEDLGHTLSVNPPVDGGTWAQDKYIGNLTGANVIRNAAQGLDALKSACFEDDASQNIYYTVLIPR